MPFDHFKLISGFYDKVGQFSISEPLIGLLSLTPNNLLLDAGGGTGRVSATLRDMVREVFIEDVSRDMLRWASKKGMATVLAPVESLPFPSDNIDRIIMMDALHHVKDQNLTAKELWRVLAPGGRIVIVEPDIHKLHVKLIAFGEKMLLMHSHFLTGEEITALFTSPEAEVGLSYDESSVFIRVEKPRLM